MFTKLSITSLICLSLASPAFAGCDAFKPFDDLLQSAKQDVAFADILPKDGQRLRQKELHGGNPLIAPFTKCRLVDEVNYLEKFETKYQCFYQEPTPESGVFPEVEDGGMARYMQSVMPKFAGVQACILALKADENYAYAHGDLSRGAVNAAFTNGTRYDGTDDVHISLTAANINSSRDRPRFEIVLEIKSGARDRDALH